MPEADTSHVTRVVPLVQLASWCRSLQEAFDASELRDFSERVWRLHVSAECPQCGIRVFGDELRALALAPSAELASAKIGRMRLGDCARLGCNAWEYSVQFWNQEWFDWDTMLQNAEQRSKAPPPQAAAAVPQWLLGLKVLAGAHGRRFGTLAVLFLGLWLAKQLYQGGRIPFFREPEQFKTEVMQPLAQEDTWPAPLDVCEGSFFAGP